MRLGTFDVGRPRCIDIGADKKSELYLFWDSKWFYMRGDGYFTGSELTSRDAINWLLSGIGLGGLRIGLLWWTRETKLNISFTWGVRPTAEFWNSENKVNCLIGEGRRLFSLKSSGDEVTITGVLVQVPVKRDFSLNKNNTLCIKIGEVSRS